MKKNWVFVVLSIAMVFSLGFVPAPNNATLNHPLINSKTTNKLVEVHLVNPTPYKVMIHFWANPAPSDYLVYLKPKSTKTIKVLTGTYYIDPIVSSDTCMLWGKNLKIRKAMRFTVVCHKHK